MAGPILKPPAVRPGAKIAVIAPASSAKTERIDLGIFALRRLGYDIIEGSHLRGRSPQYFSATPEERLQDIHSAFSDPEIDAIICSRGGYGTNYLLENIDLEMVRRNPKPFFAYSDMTVLQTWLLDKTGLISFHGPMSASDFYRENGVHTTSFDAALSGQKSLLGAAEGLRTLRGGRISGTLYGGCLSMIVSSLGTPFAAETEGKLLFLEDVNVKPYQIDRMLRQLILGGKLAGVKGIVFGEMLNCTSETEANSRVLDAVILRVLQHFDGPIGIGLRSGHVSRENVTLPFGLKAEANMNEETPTLELLEAAVRT